MIHDTTPEAQRYRWEILARMSGAQRVRQALELTDFVLRVQADGARARASSAERGERVGEVPTHESA